MNKSIEEQIEETVDIEEFAIAGKKPPKAKRYRIRIDKKKYVVDASCMTGQEILSVAGKEPPARFKLFQVFSKRRKEEVGQDEKVDFTKRGIEKFRTYPLDQTEG